MVVRTIGMLVCILPVVFGCKQLEAPTNAPAANQVSSLEFPGPDARTARFGLGREPRSDEVAAWDIDVMPDGEGLPPGSGTVDAGRALYVEQCQRCHGVDGRGGPFDVLVGRLPAGSFPFALDPTVPRTIGSYWPWATTLFDYTRRAMPLDRPGSLEDDEVYSLTAYLLHRNGLLDANASLDRDSLPLIVMPARDRFIQDDRRGGEEVR